MQTVRHGTRLAAASTAHTQSRGSSGARGFNVAEPKAMALRNGRSATASETIVSVTKARMTSRLLSRDSAYSLPIDIPASIMLIFRGTIASDF
jgi:hypothetical protein